MAFEADVQRLSRTAMDFEEEVLQAVVTEVSQLVCIVGAAE